MYLKDLKCSQPQCEEEETQEHLLQHVELPEDCGSTSVLFEKLFSSDPEENQMVAKLLQKSIDDRDKSAKD